MAGAVHEVEVKGLRELNRALYKINRQAATRVRSALKEAGEPVRETSEAYAIQRIRNVGHAWAAMRIGSTMGTVYVAPASRNRGGSPRPNLGRLLLREAMEPAVERHAAAIEKEVERALDRLGREAGF